MSNHWHRDGDLRTKLNDALPPSLWGRVFTTMRDGGKGIRVYVTADYDTVPWTDVPIYVEVVSKHGFPQPELINRLLLLA